MIETHLTEFIFVLFIFEIDFIAISTRTEATN